MITGSSSARQNLFGRLSFKRSRSVFERTQRPSFDTYSQFLETITEKERKFFDYLDLQIDKVEDFYDERYKEAVLRLAALKEQFQELAEHRTAYYVSRTLLGRSRCFLIGFFSGCPSHKDTCLEESSKPRFSRTYIQQSFEATQTRQSCRDNRA